MYKMYHIFSIIFIHLFFSSSSNINVNNNINVYSNIFYNPTIYLIVHHYYLILFIYSFILFRLLNVEQQFEQPHSLTIYLLPTTSTNHTHHHGLALWFWPLGQGRN